MGFLLLRGVVMFSCCDGCEAWEVWSFGAGQQDKCQNGMTMFLLWLYFLIKAGLRNLVKGYGTWRSCNVVRQVSSRIPARQCRLTHCKVHLQIDNIEAVHFQPYGADKGTTS